MAQYLSFDEVASKLKCNIKKVRQLVIEDKSMRATRITPNGLVLTECGLDGNFPYDLDFNCHLDDEGSITSDIYRFGANGGTEKTKTLFVGYLRVEYSELARFVTEAEFAHLSRESTLTTTPDALQVQSPATPAPVVAASDAKPWLSIDPQDPTPSQPWYTPARYFARQLTIEKPALLANREQLADKVSTALFNAGFKKRGDIKRFDSGTVLKAFANVTLG